MAALAPSSRRPRAQFEAGPSLASVFHDLGNLTGDYAVILLQPSGRIASWSSFAEHIFGIDVEHAIDRSFACLYPLEAISAGMPERDLATALDQVVGNLLSNALKYGPGKPMSVHCDADERDATVTVTDHGIGIASENLQRIFGRFERAVSERNYGGLGLGLWIAQEIAQAHGGRVDVESKAGEGAVFRLVLPRTLPPERESTDRGDAR